MPKRLQMPFFRSHPMQPTSKTELCGFPMKSAARKLVTCHWLQSGWSKCKGRAKPHQRLPPRRWEGLDIYRLLCCCSLVGFAVAGVVPLVLVVGFVAANVWQVVFKVAHVICSIQGFLVNDPVCTLFMHCLCVVARCQSWWLLLVVFFCLVTKPKSHQRQQSRQGQKGQQSQRSQQRPSVSKTSASTYI